MSASARNPTEQRDAGCEQLLFERARSLDGVRVIYWICMIDCRGMSKQTRPFECTLTHYRVNEGVYSTTKSYEAVERANAVP